MRSPREAQIHAILIRGDQLRREAFAADAAARRAVPMSRAGKVAIALLAAGLCAWAAAMVVLVVCVFVYERVPLVDADPTSLGSVFIWLVLSMVVLISAAITIGVRADPAGRAASNESRPSERSSAERGGGLGALQDDLAVRAQRDLPAIDDSVLSRESAHYLAFPDLGKYVQFFSILGQGGTAIRCVVADSVDGLDRAVADVEERVAHEGGLLRSLTYQQRHWWLEGGAPFFPAVPPVRVRA